MKISVFTDLRFTATERKTGVGKHILHMVSGLEGNGRCQVAVLAAREQLAPDGTIPEENALSFLEARRLPLTWKTAEALWTVTGWPPADRWCGGADWIYCPKNDFIPVRKCRLAVTIHGASELDPHMPQSGALLARLNRLRRRLAYQKIVSRADLILTVSEFLKGQVVEWFGAPPDKVVVVGNGVEAEYFQVADQQRGVSGETADGPFVLCVGGLNFLDGGDRVLGVAEVLGRCVPDLRVLVAGWQHLPELEARAGQMRNVQLLGYLKPNELSRLMRDAVALLFLTRYETFGIAAAEAMTAGTPVITCRVTAVPEVVGEAGLYVNPERPGETAEVIRELMANPALGAEYARRGREQARPYTWPLCVQRLQRALQTAS